MIANHLYAPSYVSMSSALRYYGLIPEEVCTKQSMTVKYAKNFAFIYRDGDWHFAPAYDLLPSDGINGYRTTSINDKIEPTKEDMFAVAVRVGLKEKDTMSCLEKIQKTINYYM